MHISCAINRSVIVTAQPPKRPYSHKITHNESERSRIERVSLCCYARRTQWLELRLLFIRERCLRTQRCPRCVRASHSEPAVPIDVGRFVWAAVRLWSVVMLFLPCSKSHARNWLLGGIPFNSRNHSEQKCLSILTQRDFDVIIGTDMGVLAVHKLWSLRFWVSVLRAAECGTRTHDFVSVFCWPVSCECKNVYNVHVCTTENKSITTLRVCTYMGNMWVHIGLYNR